MVERPDAGYSPINESGLHHGVRWQLDDRTVQATEMSRRRAIAAAVNVDGCAGDVNFGAPRVQQMQPRR